MAKAKSTSSPKKVKDIRPALMPENREAQLVSLAMDLVEQRLLDGTASSQEVTHFLKLGSQRAQVELEKLKSENKLAQAKTEQIEYQKDNGERYDKAIQAFKKYSGHGDTYDEYY